jgi:hypothetical protein
MAFARGSAVATAVGMMAWVLGTGPARADADALLDTLGPRELAVGGSMRGGATGSMGVSLNPSGLPLNRELVFEGGYGYRAQDSQSVVGVTACDSTTAAPGCFFYNYVGASPELAGGMTGARRAHTAGLAMSRLITPQIAFGSTLKYFDYESDLMDEADSSGVTFDAGLTARLSDLVTLGAAGYNLYGKESVNFPRGVGGGAVVRPMSKLTLSFDGLWNLDDEQSAGRYGGGRRVLRLGAARPARHPAARRRASTTPRARARATPRSASASPP